jgi:hypothetical protein
MIRLAAVEISYGISSCRPTARYSRGIQHCFFACHPYPMLYNPAFQAPVAVLIRYLCYYSILDSLDAYRRHRREMAILIP